MRVPTSGLLISMISKELLKGHFSSDTAVVNRGVDCYTSFAFQFLATFRKFVSADLRVRLYHGAYACQWFAVVGKLVVP